MPVVSHLIPEVHVDVDRLEQRVAVTRDADFHALLALSGVRKPSVIRIRIEPLADADLVRIVEWIVREKAQELDKGVAITVKQASIRVRELPLISVRSEEDV